MTATRTTTTDMGAIRAQPRSPIAPQKELVTLPMVGTAAKLSHTKAGIAAAPVPAVTTLHGITVVPAHAVTYLPPQRGRPMVCIGRR